MHVTLENVFERLLEPLVLDVSDLRLELRDDEVQVDLDYGREDEAGDDPRPAPAVIHL